VKPTATSVRTCWTRSGRFSNPSGGLASIIMGNGNGDSSSMPNCVANTYTRQQFPHHGGADVQSNNKEK